MTDLFCPHCDKIAKDQNALWQHVRKMHPEKKSADLKPKPAIEDESLGDFFRAVKAADKEQRWENLKAADPQGWTVHCDTHWSQKFLGERLDYWPSRNKFRWKKQTHVGDVTKFMEHELNKFLGLHKP